MSKAHTSLSPFGNVENALLYLLNHGPQRAYTLRKEMFRRRFGREMTNDERGWYSSYFKRTGMYIKRVHYVTEPSRPNPKALWAYDPASHLFSLTALGRIRAEKLLGEVRAVSHVKAEPVVEKPKRVLLFIGADEVLNMCHRLPPGGTVTIERSALKTVAVVSRPHPMGHKIVATIAEVAQGGDMQVFYNDVSEWIAEEYPLFDRHAAMQKVADLSDEKLKALVATLNK